MPNFNQIPFDKIERCGHQQLLSNNIFSVSWVLGRFCNYRCSYCWDFGRSDIRDHRSTELCLKTVDEIKRQARENSFDKFHFSFTGGEPSLHPGYLDILQYIIQDRHAPYQSLHVSTNLSNGIGWLKKFAPIAKGFQDRFITATYHSESAKIEDFLEKCEFLLSENIWVAVPIVMVPERFDFLYSCAERFVDNGINVILKPKSIKNASRVVDTYSSEQLEKIRTGFPYTKLHSTYGDKKFWQNKSEELGNFVHMMKLTDTTGQDWFLDHSERFNVFEFNRFQGWDCVGGFSNILIREPSGNIMRAHCCVDEPLGHIESGFKLYKKVKPCITPKCMGGTDNKIPKRKAGSQMPLWAGEKVE